MRQRKMGKEERNGAKEIRIKNGGIQSHENIGERWEMNGDERRKRVNKQTKTKWN